MILTNAVSVNGCRAFRWYYFLTAVFLSHTTWQRQVVDEDAQRTVAVVPMGQLLHVTVGQVPHVNAAAEAVQQWPLDLYEGQEFVLVTRLTVLHKNASGKMVPLRYLELTGE